MCWPSDSGGLRRRSLPVFPVDTPLDTAEPFLPAAGGFLFTPLVTARECLWDSVPLRLVPFTTPFLLERVFFGEVFSLWVSSLFFLWPRLFLLLEFLCWAFVVVNDVSTSDVSWKVKKRQNNKVNKMLSKWQFSKCLPSMTLSIAHYILTSYL